MAKEVEPLTKEYTCQRGLIFRELRSRLSFETSAREAQV